MGVLYRSTNKGYLMLQRHRRAELMDQPGLNYADHVRALQGLSRINTLSRTSARFWPPIFELARSREPAAGPLRVLDLATGGGDLPIALARYAFQAGVNLVIEGCDISPEAVRYAQARADTQGSHSRFFVLDVLSGTLPTGYDVVSCSLFLHHLAESDAIVLMSRMATAARSLVLIDDLVRSQLGYLLALIGCHILSGSHVVHVDGPVSAAAAFTLKEVLCLAERAGLRDVTVTRHWPQRFLLTWRAHGSARHLDVESAAGSVWDVIILGAGPAGAIAAQQLSASGVQALLVDKKSFPREKVCGACLNTSALATLRSAGLGDLLDKLGGVRLAALALGHSGHSIQFTLPGGVALSRARFDAALVNAAVDSGTAFLPHTQGVVGPVSSGMRHVLLEQTGRQVTAFARIVLVATGLGQALFKAETSVRSHPKVRSRVGAGCTLDSFSPFYREGTVFMAVGQGGYVGLVRIENDRLNVAAAYGRNHVRHSGDPGAAAVRILTEAGFASIPSLRDARWRGTLPLTRRTTPIAGERFFLIGDSTGYVEPFTGEGIAWALASGHAIAPLVVQALKGWEPSWARAWISIHRRSIVRRQVPCRAIAIVLRHPWLAHAVFRMATQAPRAAQFMIHRANTPFAFSPPV